MTDSDLPTLKNKSQQLADANNKTIRINRLLMTTGIIATTGAVVLFFFTHYLIFSILLGLTGIGLWFMRQLVKKSLSLTDHNNQLQIGSFQNQLERINKELSKCKFLEYVEAEGTQVANQAIQLLHQYKSLENILRQKFVTTELTYSRYISSVESACLSISENLLDIKNTLENLNLTNKNSSTEWEIQKNKAQTQLKFTHEALLELSKLFNSLSEISTKENHLEESMQQINELANRAKIYSKN